MATDAKRIFLIEEQIAEVGLADTHRVLEHRVEYRIKLPRRAADDFKDLGGRGLLLQRILVRSSLSRRVFSMAITAWAAKLVTNSICLSVNGRTSWR